MVLNIKIPGFGGEEWRPITNSETSKGRWECSNMCITKHAANVLDESSLTIKNGYPKVCINGKDMYCHRVVFQTWYPEKFYNMKKNEIILHKYDNKLDFRPHYLRIGTHPSNGVDAHDSGRHDNTKTERIACMSYINDVYEETHISICEAAKFVQPKNYPDAECITYCRSP